MIGLALAVETIILQRDGFAKAATEWMARYDSIAQEQMRWRDMLGSKDHENAALVRANRELHEEVRKLRKGVSGRKR